MFRGWISQLPTYPKLKLILWAAVLLVRPDGNLVGGWLWISGNKHADICSNNSHLQIFITKPVHQIFCMACQPCKQTHARSDTYTHVLQLCLRLGQMKACDIDCVLFYLTAIASLCVFFPPQWPQNWLCFHPFCCLLYLLCITQR